MRAPPRAGPDVRLPGEVRVAVARWSARHPERGVVAAAAVAWAVVLGARLTGEGSGAWWPGAGAGSAHGGHDVVVGAAGAASAVGAAAGGALAPARVAAAAGAWLLMVLAMMGPVMVPRVRRVARACLGRERLAATAATVAGALAVWALVGVVAVGLGTWAAPGAGAAADPLLFATVWLAVAAWQLTGAKSVALGRCHALRVSGGNALGRSWLTGGAAYAGWCVASCGPAMIAMVLTGHPLVLMAVLTAGLTAERVAHRTQLAVRRLAGGVAAAAVVVVLADSPQVLG